MNKIFATTAIMFVISLGQIFGQISTTTKTETTTSRDGRTETVTQTETADPNWGSITTSTYTFTGNMKASLGIKVNVGPSNFVIRDMPDCRSNMGPNLSAGGFLKFEVNNFALQYELLLRYKRSEMEDTVMRTKTDYKYWGVELPVYAMGQIHTKAGTIFIGAGPYVSFGFDAVQDPENTDLYRKDRTTGKAVMHRWDFGLGTMLGFELKNGISINAGCYQGGLVNVLSAERRSRSMKTQTVNFGIGYKF